MPTRAGVLGWNPGWDTNSNPAKPPDMRTAPPLHSAWTEQPHRGHRATEGEEGQEPPLSKASPVQAGIQAGKPYQSPIPPPPHSG